MFKFERYGGFSNKRNHVVQFKTRDKSILPTIKSIPLQPKKVVEPTTSCSSSSSVSTNTDRSDLSNDTSSAKDTTHDVSEDDDVFEFPQNEEKEIKLLVAATRPVPECTKKTTKKKKKSKTISSENQRKTPKKKDPVVMKPQRVLSQHQTPLPQVNCRQQFLSQPAPQPQHYPLQITSPPEEEEEDEEGIFDIFDFDFNPQVHVRHTSESNSKNNTTFYSTEPSHPIKPIQPNILQHPTIYPPTIDSVIHSMHTQPLTAPIVEKKRKRNLVAHLKSASGESKPTTKGFNFLSDEDEEEEEETTSDIVPFREFINKERSKSPELTYNERMELELEGLMRSEFKQKEMPAPESSARSRYQPQNKMNVKITFERKKFI